MENLGFAIYAKGESMTSRSALHTPSVSRWNGALLLAFFVVLFCANLTAHAQYPDTIWIPVTYYDFHADRSNPEFQTKDKSVGGTGMIQDTLDPDKKPIWGGDTEMGINRYIKYWYRSWADSAKGDSTKPVYEASGSDEDLDYIDTNPGHDTAFINLTFRDSLPFTHIGDGIYEYKNDEFFPLDGKGFGQDHKSDTEYKHNFAFTMELHTEFTMKPGITFRFTGDDDVWAFVNNNLEMDIGGIHNAQTDSFNVDELGLTPGENYSFDFFFAERHTSASHIWITTNIISTNLVSVNLKAEPNDTIQAGEAVTAWAEVLDDTGGVHAGYGDLITWSFIDNGGNDDSTLSGHNGDTIFFTPTEAYSLVKIQGTLLDTFTGDYLRDTLNLYVLPGDPDHLVIEGSPSVSGSGLRDDQEISGITIGSTELHKNAFANIRDRYGNFVENSDLTDWNIISGAQYLDSVVVGNAEQGEGIAYKQGDAGTATISATSNRYSGVRFTDNLNVTINPVDYTSIRILVNDRGVYRAIDNLTMTTDQCTLLIVEGLRSDGKGWDVVDGNWSSTLPSKNSPPLSSQTFDFCPLDTGSGQIQASYLDAPGASVNVRVTPGGPASLSLYPQAGTPLEQSAYDDPPVFYFAKAGEAFDIYAKVFDKNNYWLSQYESSSAPISWRIDAETEPIPGTLSKNSGYHTSFTPTIAYRTVRITATFSEGGRIFNDEILIKTQPGDPHHLSIQADTATINGTDLQQITLSPSDTLRKVYAVIKDTFDNYISFAQLASWNSNDPSIAHAQQGAAIFSGEGEIYRRSDSTAQTVVTATSQDGKFSDSLDVLISKITYTDVEIGVYTNTFVNIDTLRIRTDQDTTLYARGKRSDNAQWVDIAVPWSGPAALQIQPAAPGSDDKWSFSPGKAGSGLISATAPGDIRDQIVILAEHGLANKLVVYRSEQPPSQAQPFANPTIRDTVAAGDSLLLAANVFDHLNVWLQEYRSAPLNAKITWRILEQGGLTGTGVLTSEQGAVTKFAPTIAYRTVRIVASLQESNGFFRDTATVYIKPGKPDHLVIEASSQISSLNADDPVSVLTLSPRDTAKSVHAILRDKYQNFVGYSQKTAWISLDSAVVTAAEGVKIFGEGRVFRQTVGGETKVIARNRDLPSLFDTVAVVLTDIFYDSLRIVTAPENRIEELLLQTGYDTTLYVEGKRSDNGLWQPVEADWHIAQQLEVAPPPPAQSQSWSFSPERDGSGLLHVSLGSSVRDTIRAIFSPGDPAVLRLYDFPGMPVGGDRPLPDPETKIDLRAGVSYELFAKLFDKNDKWLEAYESGDSADAIQWRVIENNGNRNTGSLEKLNGSSNSFTPTVAYRTVAIEAKGSSPALCDTVAFRILPGPAHHAVIEGSQDRNVSPNADNPIDTVFITSTDTLKSVYAILRDQYGNFVSHSKITDWTSADPSIAEAEDGNSNIGQGLVTRRNSGLTRITAQNKENLSLQKDSDDAYVKVLAYYYTELRVRIENQPDADTLKMTTNDSASVYVEGKRSDNDDWEPVSSAWGIHDSLSVTPAAPENSGTWSFSPDRPGEGWVRAYMDNDLTAPDSLPVVFERGKPVAVEIDVLTPPEQQIAGDTITAVVRIRNTDGLVPGTWCYPANGGSDAEYGDTLGNGGRKDPIVIVDSAAHTIEDKIATAEQCFEDGVDTVQFVLFYAPHKQDKAHVLTVRLNDIAAESDPIFLRPGALDSLALEKANGEAVPDTIHLAYPEGAVTLRSIGYDAYGNRIGQTPSDWSVDESLHRVKNGENTPQIYYSATDVTDFEQGWMTATAHDSIEASTYIRITGPGVNMRTAFTRDLDGDGLLDAVEIRFDKAVALPQSFFSKNVSDHFDIVYAGQPFTTFAVDSVSGGADQADTAFFVYFEEQYDENNPQPQTDWRLTLTLRNAGDTINEVSDTLIQDGAGPVIWEVIKHANSNGDRTRDKVVVTFSEPVAEENRSPLRAGMAPEELFNVWYYNQNNETFSPADSMIDGIEELASPSPDSVVFYMTNGNDLTGGYYFSFRTEGGVDLADDQLNTPSETNRKTRVVVIGAIGEIAIGPNPVVPTANYFESKLTYVEPREAHRRATREGGAIMAIELILDGENVKKKATGRMIIFDAVGNLVYTRENRSNLIPSEWRNLSLKEEGEGRQLVFYWNGMTESRKKAAPGLYRVALFIDFDGTQRKYTGNVGISR